MDIWIMFNIVCKLGGNGQFDECFFILFKFWLIIAFGV